MSQPYSETGDRITPLSMQARRSSSSLAVSGPPSLTD